MYCDPLRLIRKPASRNSAPVEKPWFTMYSVAPEPASAVMAKTPIVMKPKCEIDV